MKNFANVFFYFIVILSELKTLISVEKPIITTRASGGVQATSSPSAAAVAAAANSMAESKSKILIIGVTGNLGFELAKASLNASHPTLGLIRDSAFSDPNKLHKIQLLSDSGLKIVKACPITRLFPLMLLLFGS